MANNDIQYGVVRNAEALGKLVRAHRKSRGITLQKIGGLANLGVRFLSEFERGKETAELEKVLKTLNSLGLEVTIQPRKVHVATSHKLPYSLEATEAVEKPDNKKP